MSKSFSKRLVAALVVATGQAICLAQDAPPATLSVPYSAYLDKQGVAYTGLCDFEFVLWDAAAGGTQIAEPIRLTEVPILNGQISTQLRFETSTHGPRFLEVHLREMNGEWVALAPRQEVPDEVQPGKDGTPQVGGPQGAESRSGGKAITPRDGHGAHTPGAAPSEGGFGVLSELGGTRQGEELRGRIPIPPPPPPPGGTDNPGAGDICWNTHQSVPNICYSTNKMVFTDSLATLNAAINNNTINESVFYVLSPSTRLVARYVGGGNCDTAVYATTFKTNGDSYGLVGQAVTSVGVGVGVKGESSASSGAGRGIYGKTNSPSGYGGYFEGRGYFSGLVGVGTSAPAAPLTVNLATGPLNMSAHFSDGSNSALTVAHPSPFTTAMGAANDGFLQLGGFSSDHSQFTPTVTLFPAVTGGGMSIGTTFPVPDAKLHLYGSGLGNDTATLLIETAGGSQGPRVRLQSNVAPEWALLSGGSSDLIFPGYFGVICGNNPTVGITIAPNGSCFNSSGTWTAFSDARLKSDVRPLAPGSTLERLLALHGVTYRYSDEAVAKRHLPGGTRTGFIAQEVEQVFPQWVSESPDGYKTVSEQGSTALLVEALRGLRAEKDAQIASLQADNADLRSRLERLETLVESMASKQAK